MNAVSSSLPLPLFPRPIFMYRILTLILFQVCDDQIRNGGTLAPHGNKFCDMHVQVTREDHRVVVAAAFWISMSMDLAMELRKS
jgi:acyl-ACP thioesterase